jgi:putative FmdB family regulatory protein
MIRPGVCFFQGFVVERGRVPGDQFSMPLYEYELCDGTCAICKGRFELRRPLTAPPLEKCPLCRRPVRKLVSRANTPVVSAPLSVSDAKSAGFTILEKRDDGAYEKL